MPNLPNISPELVKAYRDEIARRSSPATAKRKGSSLNKFLGWAEKEGHIDENPLANNQQTLQPVLQIPQYQQTQAEETHKNTSKDIKGLQRWFSGRNIIAGGSVVALIILALLLVNKLKLPIPFRPAPAQEANIPNVEPQTKNPVALSAWGLYAKLTLKDKTGTPVTKSQPITFKLYKSPNDTKALYTGTKTITPDSSGNSLIYLDDVPRDLFFQNQELYLATEISGTETDKRFPISTANESANLQGYFPAKEAGPNTIPVLSDDGSLLLAAEAPSVKATSGNLSVEGQALTLKTADSSGGDITINPDGSGIAHFLFEGNNSNFLNAQAPNLTSGSLYYGIVANDATGYDLIKLQNGSTPSTKFEVDASGNTNLAGDLTTGDSVRLTAEGGLENITSYDQTSGNFSIDQSAGDSASISKNDRALSDVLNLTLDERGKGNSTYSTLVLNRYDGANEAMALLVNNGNAQFNGQLRLGRYTSNPTAIGTGTLVYNSSDDNVYVWTGTTWVAIGGLAASTPFSNISSATNTTAAMVVGTGASLTYSGSGTINATTLNSIADTSFLRSDASDAFTSGTLTTNAGTTLDIEGNFQLGGSAGSSGQLLTSAGSGSTPTWSNIASLLTGGTDISVSGTTNATIDNTSTLSSVTGRGASTATQVSLNGGITSSSDLTISPTGNINFYSSSNSLDSSGNLTIAGTTTLNGITYTWPGSQSANYILQTNGSGTLSWEDPATVIGDVIYWSQANGAVYAKSSTVDLLLGGNSTASAKFAVKNINSGTPTASISGSTANVATYLTGEGTLATTNSAPLTVGSSSTGNIQFYSASNTIDSSGNLTIAGNLDVNGTSNDIAGTLNLSGGNLTSTGALTVTPQAGNNLNVDLSTTGDLAVNTDQLYVDTSAARVGVGTTTPDATFHVVGGDAYVAPNSGYSFDNPSANEDLYVYGNLEVDGTIYGNVSGTINPGFTTGSIIFQGASGLAQDNANFFYDSTNAKVGFGTNSPTGKLHVTGAVTGKALAIFDETGDQAILTASAGGIPKLAITNSGSLEFYQASSITTSTGNLTLDSGSSTLNLNTTGGGAITTGTGQVTLAGNVNATNGLDVTNANLTVGGANFSVDQSNGNVTTAGTVTLPNSNTLTGVSSYTEFSNGISVGGATTYYLNSSGNLNANAGTFAGTLTANGNTVLGNATSDTVTYTGRVNSNIIPSADNTYDLGSSSLRWANIYAASVVGTISPGFTQGSIVFTDASGNLAQDNASLFFDDTNNKVGIGTNSPIGKLTVQGAATGKALAVLDETGDQNILTASASGTNVANLDRSGNLAIEGAISDLSGTKLVVNDNLQVNGNNIFDSGSANRIQLGSTINLTGDVVVSQDFGTDGNTTLGDTLIADRVTYNSRVASNIEPTTDNTYNLGSASLRWANIYANTLYQGANQVCDTSGNCLLNGLWTDSSGAIYPKNTSEDVLIGGNSTESAKFAFTNVIGAGVPTASVSAGVNGATYLTADGTIATTARQPLTLGASASSGDIQFYSSSNKIDTSGNLTLAGDVTLTSGGTIASTSNGNITIDTGAGTLNLNTTGNGAITSGTGQITLAGNVDATNGLDVTNANLTVGGANFSVDQSNGNVTTAGTVTLPNTNTLTGVSNYVEFNNGISIGGATTYYFDSTGNLNANAGTFAATLTANGDSVLGNAITDNITFNGRVAQDSDLIPIGTTGTNDLGSASLPWDNIYGVTIYQNGNQVCDTGGNCPAGLWTESSGAIYPLNSSEDVLIGGTSTSSAQFAFINVIGSGTPTASISGTTAYVATYLTGEGNLATTNAAPLTLGNTSTSGDVQFFSSSNTVDASGNITLAGILDINGGGNSDIAGTLNLSGGALTSTGALTITPQAGNNLNIALSTTGDFIVNTNHLVVDTSTGRVGIGTTSPAQALDVYGKIAESGTQIAYLPDQTSFTGTLYLGNGGASLSHVSGIDGKYNTAVGIGALYYNTTGAYNTANGFQALYYNTTGSYNTANGSQALYYNGSAISSTAVGYQAARGTAAYSNQGGTYLGYNSGYSADTGSDYNTLLGFRSGYDVTTGANNLILGTEQTTGSGVTTGSNNILLGKGVRYGLDGTASNQLNIGNLIFATGLGSENTLSTGKVGIGTTSPTESLDVAGNATVSGNLTLYGGTRTIAGREAADLTLGDSQTGNINFYSASNYIDASGNLTIVGNLNASAGTFDGTLTANADTVLGNTGTDTVTFNAEVNSDILPSTTNAYDLGSDSLRWANIYATNIYQNGNLVCDTGGSCTNSGVWTEGSGAIYPKNNSEDVLIGGTSTSSAQFAFINVVGSGAPTASIAGTTANVATYLTGEGNLATTNSAPLTLGNTSTSGNVQFFSSSNKIDSSGNFTAAGVLDINGGGTSDIAGTLNLSGDNLTSTTDLTIAPAGGNVLVTGNILPTTTRTYNLGGNSGRWSNLYLGTNIYIDDGFSNSVQLNVSSGDNFYLQGASGGYHFRNGTSTDVVTINSNGNLGVGSGLNPVSKLDVEGAVTGKALVMFNETGDQNILTASADGTPKVNIQRDGTLEFNQTSSVTTTTGDLNLSPAGNLVTTNEGDSALYFTGSSPNIRFATTNIPNIYNYASSAYQALNIGNDSTLLYVDGGSGRVGVGDNSPAALFTVGSGDKFQVDSSGNITLANGETIDNATNGVVAIGTDATAVLQLPSNAGTGGLDTTNGNIFYDTSANKFQCYENGSWTNCIGAGGGTSYWTFDSGNGTLYPNNNTTDVFIGGDSTASAQFAFKNVDSGTPTASISGSTANVATYLTGEGNLQTTNSAPLTIGGDSTGNITLKPQNGSGSVTLDTNALNSTAATFNLINTSATTAINFGQNATSISIGATTGTTTVRNSIFATTGVLDVNGAGTSDIAGTLNLSGNTLTSTGDLTINPGGGQVILQNTRTLNVGGKSNVGYNVFANSSESPTSGAIGADNDLFVGGDFEAGNIYLSTGGTFYTGLTSGSVTFIGSSGQLAEDNTNFFWDTSGLKLGIGTNSPIGKLHLTGDAGGNALAILDETGGQDILTASASGTTRLTLANDGTLKLYNASSSITNTSGDITIDAASNNISFSGDDVSDVGTLTAGTGIFTSVLQVAGPTAASYSRFGTNTADHGGVSSGDDLLISGALELDSSLYLDNGIIANSAGTTSIAFTATPTTGQNTLGGSAWLVENGANVGLAALTVNQTKAGDIFTASASGSPKFVIDNSGNVGIGNTIPNHLLDVAGNIGLSAGGYINFGSTDGTSGYGFRDNSGTIEFKNSAGVWTGVGSGSGGGEWTLGSGVLYTNNNTADVLIGSSATSSAKFAFTNVLTGTPTLNIGSNPLALSSDGSNASWVNSAGSSLFYNHVGTSGTSLAFRFHATTSDTAVADILNNGDFVLKTGVLQVGDTTPGGYNRLGTTTPTHTGNITSSSDLLINGDLELDTTLFLDGGIIADSGGTTNISLTASPLTGYNVLGATSWEVVNDANGAKAALTVVQNRNQDLFTASASGTTRFYIKNDGSTFIDGTASTLFTVGGGTGKVDVGTVDPVYQIGNTKYATYLSGMTGVKEETTGNVTTNQFVPGVGYKHTIDFKTTDKSSDTWLFAKATDIAKHINDLVVLLSASGNIKTWYEVNPDQYTVSIYTSRPTTVSYRLTAPRFDSSLWTNYNDNPGSTGFQIADTPITVSDNGYISQANEKYINSVTVNPTATSDAFFSNTQIPQFGIADSLGNVIQDISTAYKFVAANIKSGAIETKYIAADTLSGGQATIDNLLINSGLVTPVIKTKTISPLANESDVNVQIGNNTKDNGYGKLNVKNASGSSVASIDTTGNATFSGEVTSDKVKTNDVIAGKIYADEIIARNGKFGNLASATSSAVTLDQIEALLKQAETDQQTLSTVTNSNIYTATDSASLNDLTASDLYITNQAAINSLSVTSYFSVGSDLVIQSQDINGIQTNSIDTLTAPLQIQTLALAPIQIMAGKISINTNGDVSINGNVYIAGNVDAQGLTLRTDPTNGKTATNSGFLKIIGDNGNPTASINASGSAQFNTLSTDKLVIAGSQATTSASLLNGLVTETNSTAGTATISAGVREIRIESPKITKDTLVYVTPTSSTLNNVLYVKSKGEGYFVAGFEHSLNINVSFNWWVIDVTNQEGGNN